MGAALANIRRIANIEIVLIVQVILARGKLAAANRRHPAVVNLHEIVAETRQILLGSRAEALSQSNQEQQRSHSPRYAEHSEEAAKLVRPDGTQDLSKAVGKSPHIVRLRRAVIVCR